MSGKRDSVSGHSTAKSSNNEVLKVKIEITDGKKKETEKVSVPRYNFVTTKHPREQRHRYPLAQATIKSTLPHLGQCLKTERIDRFTTHSPSISQATAVSTSGSPTSARS